MMKLAIYQYCDESQRLPHELSIRFAWCDCAPSREDVVAMGGESNWQVADVSTYAGDSSIEQVYLVSIYRETCPARSQWELSALKKTFPYQSLQVQTVAVGGEILGFEIDFSGEKPKLHSPLVRYGIREDTFVTRREAWQVDRVEAFSSSDPITLFHRIDLVFYRAVEMPALVAQT